jgi:2-keto-3-deoxy-L-rhamnonate aldolase RhmA
MKENSIRRAVREGRAALGTGLKEFASRGVPWIIEEAGFDYCTIDHEHGAFDMETIANLASWFQATNVTAIVRIHKSFAHLIPGILDQGIMGIQVSEVETAQEARDCPPGEVSADREPGHLRPGARGHTRDTRATAPATPPNTRHGRTRT